jgi:hypothetical protein
MRIQAVFAVALLCAATSQATPARMQIGSMAIDHYNLTGSGAANFDYMIGFAQNLYYGAVGKVSIGLLQGMQFTDVQVTRSAVTDNTVGSGAHREENTFVIYGGHGDHGSLYLGGTNLTPYGFVYPGNMRLGEHDTRFFWMQSCLAFNQAGSPIIAWSPAFHGVRAVLGYSSDAYDYSQSLALMQTFWTSWVTNSRSLFQAFADSQQEFYYRTGTIVEVGCISAAPKAGKPDYCQQSYSLQDTTKADSSAGSYYKTWTGPQFNAN